MRRLARALALAAVAWGAASSAGGALADTEGALHALFESGNEAYEAGSYEEAASAYRGVLDEGIDSAAVHYNLGNALFKLNELGPAIAEYERAARLDPADADIRANLEYLRSLLVDRIVPASSPMSALGIGYLLGLTSPAQDAAIFLAAWLAAGTAIGVFIVARGSRVRRAALYLACAALVPALAAGASLSLKHYLEATRVHGIVVEQEVAVLSGAGEGNPALFTVHEGLKVLIRSRAGGWVQVSLPDGLTGWMPEQAVERI